ncbi:YceI family protein [Ahniella affigens]|nr:YceI family protein [Ahniella affigens]
MFRNLVVPFVAVLLTLAGHAAAAATTDWHMTSGSLTFSGTQQGEPFTGTFKAFTVKLKFDPAHPEQSQLDVQIDLRSADSQLEERDAALQSAEWFDTERQPFAQLSATGGKRLTDGRFELPATLIIHAKQKAIAFPFTWTVNGETAKLDSVVHLNRLDFDLGTGDWADPDWVGHDVQVTVSVTFAAMPPEANVKPSPTTE